MNKQKALKWLNLALIIQYVLVAVTGILAFAGLLWDVDGAREIHVYAGLAMIITSAFHLWLNWGWVKLNFFKKRG